MSDPQGYNGSYINEKVFLRPLSHYMRDSTTYTTKDPRGVHFKYCIEEARKDLVERGLIKEKQQ